MRNRSLYCMDNLEVLRALPEGCMDLIYLDPPFNKNKYFIATKKETPKGGIKEKKEGTKRKAGEVSEESSARFKDIFAKEDVSSSDLGGLEKSHPRLMEGLRLLGGLGLPHTFFYLAYMALRLVELVRILKCTGTLYLHVDPDMSHYLKVLLDCLLGPAHFRNEIIWCYQAGSQPKKDFAKKHDVILRYSKTADYYFDATAIKEPYSPRTLSRLNYKGAREKDVAKVYARGGKRPVDYWHLPSLQGNAKEYLHYPTQKPLALLERIIQASSREKEWVLDPFCGAATTCLAAERLGRQWIGIDNNTSACLKAVSRLEKELSPHTKKAVALYKGIAKSPLVANQLREG